MSESRSRAAQQAVPAAMPPDRLWCAFEPICAIQFTRDRNLTNLSPTFNHMIVRAQHKTTQIRRNWLTQPVTCTCCRILHILHMT